MTVTTDTSLPSARRFLGAMVSLLVCLLACACGALPPRGPAGLPPIDARPAQTIAIQPAREEAVVSAHPLASKAAMTMLSQGGSATDAAIAAQWVLGLVEPQSSGIGGGALVMHHDAISGKLVHYEGLAAAPARSTASLRHDVDGSLLEANLVQRGARSVGVPGLVPVLALAHARHGRLPWASLFAPAIALAEEGYPIAPYVHAILSLPGAADAHPDLLASHFDARKRPLPAGTIIRNPAQAMMLRRLAARGPQGLYDEGGAQAMLAVLARGPRASLITERDLRDYQAREREPVCGSFIAYRICLAGPPSFGGIAVLQMLQIIERRAGGVYDFGDPAFLHLFAEAGKLAQADRMRWVGDPDFVKVPSQALVSANYLAGRASLIDPLQANPDPPAGEPVPMATGQVSDESEPGNTTSQIAVVDRSGNAITITTTINLNFGSRLLVEGFVLNNAMSNFSAAPRAGQTMANRMEGRKRPVTSMAPLIVYDSANRPVVVGGSAGGGQIVDYITRSLIEMLANQRSPLQAIAAGHLSSAVRGQLQLEAGTALETHASALRLRGHAVTVLPMISGLGFLKHTPQTGWLGAADPRRDGVAIGR